MPQKAFTDDNKLHIFFDNNEVTYHTGHALTGFINIDISKVDAVLDDIIKAMLLPKAKQAGDSVLAESELSYLNSLCPYMYFYTGIFFGFLHSFVRGKIYNMAEIFKALPKYDSFLKASDYNDNEIIEKYYPESYVKNCKDSQKSLMARGLKNILALKDTIVNELSDKTAQLREELEFVFAKKDDEPQSSRLYNYEATGERESSFFKSPSLTVTLESINGESRYREVYTINTLDDLIKLELFKAAGSKTAVKVCANCKMLFAPSGRADTMYCSRTDEATGKSCVEKGAITKYKQRTVDNPVFEAYNKAYKRNNSRLRSDKMTKSEFKMWSSKAREMRDEALAGSVDFDSFVKWLRNN